MELAREHAERVVVSVFVNPTQFGPGEDYDRYPRTWDTDCEKCQAVGVDGIFAPSVDEMYPPDAPTCDVDVPALTVDLEGARRPGHFQGVCRVVAKLFNMVQPDVAVFGQKDYQQLAVIRAMTCDLAMPIDIVPGPTVREADGLAMSSRNRYLTADQREHAVGLYKALQQAKYIIEDQGETDPALVEEAMQQIITAHGFALDYAVVRHPQTLAKLDCIEPALTAGVVCLLAAKLGDVRLIDNMLVKFA